MMEMCYDGALVMPSSYALMNEDEMSYLNGGWCIENKLWGYNIYLTHRERKKLSDCQEVAGLISAAASCGIAPLVLAAVRGIIANHDDGHGVRIRMTGAKTKAIITGVYALTKNQEKNIASKNKIIW